MLTKCVKSIRFLYNENVEGTGGELQAAIQLIRPSVVSSFTDTDSVVLNDGALEFMAAMVRDFSGALGNLPTVGELPVCEASIGRMPAFSKKTEGIRKSEWQVEPPRPNRKSSAVELLFAAADGKAMEQALRSGASSLLADLDDSQIPSWHSIVEGHVNILEATRDVCRRREEEGTTEGFTLAVRPRGLRQTERHVLVDGGLVSAGMFDVGIFTYNTSAEMLSSGLQPHLYLPKMESHFEARAWNSILDYIEMQLALPANFIKVRIQVDDITAVFELDEIVAELSGRATGMSFDRWGYTFSLVRHFGIAQGFVLHESSLIGKIPAYVEACERYVAWMAKKRGLSSAGMISAHPPFCENSDECAGDCLRHEMEREFQLGNDIIIVAEKEHIRTVVDVSSSCSPTNVANRFATDDETGSRLLTLPTPKVTMKGIKTSINAVLRFLASSLSTGECTSAGEGKASISAIEACRSMLWQWARAKTITSDGRPIHGRFVASLIDEELGDILKSVGGDERRRNYEKAALILKKVTSSHTFLPSIFEYANPELVE